MPLTIHRLLLEAHGCEGVVPLAEHLHTYRPASAQSDREVAALIDVDAGIAADSPLVYGGEHPLTVPIAYFVHIEMPVLPGVGPRLQERDHLAASIHGLLDPSGHARHVPLDRGVVETRGGHRIAAADGQEASPHDLHVLLRHRLFLQAEVGEGMCAVVVAEHPAHLAVTEVEHLCGQRRHPSELHSAGFARPAVVAEHQDALVVELADLIRLNAVALPGAQILPPQLCHPRRTRRAERVRPVWDDELNLRICPLGRGPIAALPGRVNRAHEVQVLRHRLLLKADDFEGLVLPGTSDARCDLAVAQREDHESAFVDWDAALAPDRARVNRHDDLPPHARPDIRPTLQLTPSLFDPLHPGADAGVASKDG